MGKELRKGVVTMNALENIKILDLSEKLTISLATMYLSAYGAEITKIERPNEGDKTRRWEPMKNGGSLYFNYLNGGKKSITLDISTKEGTEILKKMIPFYDVICVGTEAGYMESLGLGYEDLKKIKSDIIYASYSYYGETGPYKNKPASSLTAQAKGVAMDMTGVHNEYPVQSAPSIAEHYSAAYFATGIVMALVDKNIRGIGQKVDIALLDSIYSCIEAAPAAYSTVGEVHKRKGNFDPSCAPYDTFQTSDGYVAVGVATQNQWEKFCDVLELKDLKEDPRFIDNEGRRTDYIEVLRPILAKRLSVYTKTEIENKCRTQGIPCCAVLTIPEITDLPNTLENGYMVSVFSEKYGMLHYPSIPFVLSDTKAKSFVDASALGQDTNACMKTIGITEEEIQKLQDKNII